MLHYKGKLFKPPVAYGFWAAGLRKEPYINSSFKRSTQKPRLCRGPSTAPVKTLKEYEGLLDEGLLATILMVHL